MILFDPDFHDATVEGRIAALEEWLGGTGLRSPSHKKWQNELTRLKGLLSHGRPPVNTAELHDPFRVDEARPGCGNQLSDIYRR